MSIVDEKFQIRSNQPSVEYARWLQYRIDKIREDIEQKSITGGLKSYADEAIFDCECKIKEVSGLLYHCYDLYYLGELEELKIHCSETSIKSIERCFANPDKLTTDIYFQFADNYRIKDFNTLALSTSEIILDIGELSVITVFFFPIGYSASDLEFDSDDLRIASVNPEGVIIAVSAGKTTVTVRTKDGRHIVECLVSVVPDL